MNVPSIARCEERATMNAEGVHDGLGELVVDAVSVDGYERVIRGEDARTGLVAYIAVHSTALGPALGGARFYPFDDEDAALTDVLRLAKGMTYKSAVAGNDLGGGKSVAIVEPDAKTPELLRSFGRLVDSLAGSYITAADVGTNSDDLVVVREVTPYVGGLPRSLGGSGDPSPMTAVGVHQAMRAAAAHRLGSNELAGLSFVVVGVGKVGHTLVELLVADGGDVTVADVDEAAVSALVSAYGVSAVSPAEAHAQRCDVFAPCALGAALSSETIPQLGCQIVVGAANNQLATPECARLLAERGILYVPDYLANAGGVINIAEEQGGYDEDRARMRVETIYDRTLDVLRTAEEEHLEPVTAAEAIAMRRLAAANDA
ncbi:MAG: Glu/Leu/Phe/Val dehydrogenase dimerization domain-containing protein [Ilumatobacteraceae bacterium]